MAKMGAPETTSTFWTYWAAKLRIGDPPLVVRRLGALVGPLWLLAWLRAVIVGKSAIPSTMMVLGAIWMLGFYFVDRIQPGKGGRGPHYPVRPISRMLLIAVGLVIFIAGWREAR